MSILSQKVVWGAERPTKAFCAICALKLYPLTRNKKNRKNVVTLSYQITCPKIIRLKTVTQQTVLYHYECITLLSAIARW